MHYRTGECCVAFTCKLLFSFNLPFGATDDGEYSLIGAELRCAVHRVRLSAEQIPLLFSGETQSRACLLQRTVLPCSAPKHCGFNVCFVRKRLLSTLHFLTQNRLRGAAIFLFFFSSYFYSSFFLLISFSTFLSYALSPTPFPVSEISYKLTVPSVRTTRPAHHAVLVASSYLGARVCPRTRNLSEFPSRQLNTGPSEYKGSAGAQTRRPVCDVGLGRGVEPVS